MLFVGLDDTDTLDTRGTGHLARSIAADLASRYVVLGVVRHQLLRDPRVPCTKNNSSATVLLDGPSPPDAGEVLERVRRLMLDQFVPGSDPGLCVAAHVPPEITDFGRRAQRILVTQDEARALARTAASGSEPFALLGLGGDEDGVIGALAAVGLAACGDDGRYVQVGRLRELSGLQPVAALLAAGIAAVQTRDGSEASSHPILTDKLRPARRGGRPVAVVEWAGEHWLPLKLD